MQWKEPFWDNDAAVTGVWNPALREVCAVEPTESREASRELRLCFRAAWAACSSTETVTGAGNCREFLRCHCSESFDFRGCQSPASTGLLNRIRASDWKQMAQAVHEATLCMEQMLRMTSNSAYAHYRYSFILIYSLQKRNSEHKSLNSSSTLPESALT